MSRLVQRALRGTFSQSYSSCETRFGKKDGILTVNLLPKMFSDYTCGPIVDFEMLNRDLWYLKVRKEYALGHYYQQDGGRCTYKCPRNV